MFNKSDMAKMFATEKHQGQVYDGKTYMVHVAHVVAALNQYFPECGDDEIAAAWLHDTMEDTNTTYEEIHNIFGKNVADLVELLTDKDGANRRERHKNTYPAISKSESACMIKLCDRLANTVYAVKTKNEGILSMYRKEHDYFKKMIYKKSNAFVAAQSKLDELLEDVNG